MKLSDIDYGAGNTTGLPSQYTRQYLEDYALGDGIINDFTFITHNNTLDAPTIPVQGLMNGSRNAMVEYDEVNQCYDFKRCSYAIASTVRWGNDGGKNEGLRRKFLDEIDKLADGKDGTLGKEVRLARTPLDGFMWWGVDQETKCPDPNRCIRKEQGEPAPGGFLYNFFLTGVTAYSAYVFDSALVARIRNFRRAIAEKIYKIVGASPFELYIAGIVSYVQHDGEGSGVNVFVPSFSIYVRPLSKGMGNSDATFQDLLDAGAGNVLIGRHANADLLKTMRRPFTPDERRASRPAASNNKAPVPPTPPTPPVGNTSVPSSNSAPTPPVGKQEPPALDPKIMEIMNKGKGKTSTPTPPTPPAPPAPPVPPAPPAGNSVDEDDEYGTQNAKLF